MSKIINWKPSAEFEPLPEGVQTAVIVAVPEMGLQPGFDGKKPSIEYAICFEFETRVKDGPNMGKRRTLWITISASLHEKSKLAGILRAAGFDLAVARRDGFDLDALIGKSLQIGITHDIKADRRYARAGSFYKLPVGVQALTPEHPPTEPLPDFLAERRDRALSPTPLSPAPIAPPSTPAATSLRFGLGDDSQRRDCQFYANVFPNAAGHSVFWCGLCPNLIARP
jgi:hypothetical protein